MARQQALERRAEERLQRAADADSAQIAAWTRAIEDCFSLLVLRGIDSLLELFFVFLWRGLKQMVDGEGREGPMGVKCEVETQWK